MLLNRIFITKDTTAFAVLAMLAGSTIAAAQTPPPAGPPPPAPATAPPAPSDHRIRTMVVNSLSSGSSYLGVGLGEINADRARQLKLKEEQGVEVTRVEDESPASRAGLKSGDVVLEYNGQRVEGMEQFARFVRETPVGREVKLSISRDGNRQMVIVKAGQRKSSFSLSVPPVPPMPPKPRLDPDGMAEFKRQVMVWSGPRMGIDGESVEGQLGQFFGVKEGVLIRAVTKGSSAEKAGLKAGDVLTKVDGAPIVSISDVTRAIRAARSKKTFPVILMREKREMTVTMTIEDSEDRSQRHQFFVDDEAFEFDPGTFDFQFEMPKGLEGLRVLRSIQL